jgi:hypothetical protein
MKIRSFDGKITDRRKPMYWEKNLHQPHFDHYSSTLITLLSHRGFRGKKYVINA